MSDQTQYYFQIVWYLVLDIRLFRFSCIWTKSPCMRGIWEGWPVQKGIVYFCRLPWQSLTSGSLPCWEAPPPPRPGARSHLGAAKWWEYTRNIWARSDQRRGRYNIWKCTILSSYLASSLTRIICFNSITFAPESLIFELNWQLLEIS